MNNKDLILSIDNGTQSIRALIYDLNGQLLAKERVTFEPYFSKKPGWAEQNPEVFWNSLCTACQNLFADNSQYKKRIAGVALTTQRGTVINLDKDGNPLRPAILWLDQRKIDNPPSAGFLWELIFRLLKVNDTVNHFKKEAEINWIYKNQPEVWKKTYKFLLLSGYLTYRLTGEYIDSVGCQVGYIPFDYKKQTWAQDWDWRWKGCAINRDIMPELVSPGKHLGYITKQASKDSGIPAGLPLIAAAADKACEVIGSGSLDPSVGCLSYGTTATINVTSQKYFEAIPYLPPYPSAVPDYYTIEVQIFRGFWMVTWIKKILDLDDESQFDALVKDIPPGSMGLVLQPYWSPGVRFPGPEAKGSILGFGDVHTKGHICRAILEGLAYALREGKERIENRIKIPITSLRVSGGGSQSEVAMQVTADIFGLPTQRPHVYETSGLGAAIDAAVGLGMYSNFKDAVTNMTHIGDFFEPNQKNYEMYNDLYNKVYIKMYKNLKSLYERIREITGYPT